MNTDKFYVLGDLIKINLNKYHYVWIGRDHGGNYDLLTGYIYIPDGVNNTSIGKLMNRHDYYNMFPKEYPEIKCSNTMNMFKKLLPF